MEAPNHMTEGEPQAGPGLSCPVAAAYCFVGMACRTNTGNVGLFGPHPPRTCLSGYMLGMCKLQKSPNNTKVSTQVSLAFQKSSCGLSNLLLILCSIRMAAWWWELQHVSASCMQMVT